MDISTYVGTKEAAAALSVSPRHVHRLIQSGDLHAAKLPGYKGAYVINPDDLDRLVRARQS